MKKSCVPLAQNYLSLARIEVRRLEGLQKKEKFGMRRRVGNTITPFSV